LRTAFDAGSDTLNSFDEAQPSKSDTITDALMDFADKARSKLENAVDPRTNTVSEATRSVLEAVYSGGEKLGPAVQRYSDALINYFDGLQLDSRISLPC
jgi:hypothetical protein